MISRPLGAVALLIFLGPAACGSGSPTPSRSVRSSATPSATASATPQLVGTTRTVLSPLGLRMHSSPSLSDQNVVGNLGEGATLTVLDYRPDGGGWFKVQGQTVTGWIVADPTLTAAGSFTPYQSDTGFSVLIPDSWSFQQESFGVAFIPQSGAESILVISAANLAALGPPGLAGYTRSLSQAQVVCGYTGALEEYTRNAAGGATPSPIPVRRLQMYAEIRLKFDATHAMLLGFNYDTSAVLDVFQNFYNSISFPFPLCEQTSTPTPSPH